MLSGFSVWRSAISALDFGCPLAAAAGPRACKDEAVRREDGVRVVGVQVAVLVFAGVAVDGEQVRVSVALGVVVADGDSGAERVACGGHKGDGAHSGTLFLGCTSTLSRYVELPQEESGNATSMSPSGYTALTR